MAKHLSENDINKILNLIDSWQGKLTWDSLCDKSKILVGKRPTRQSLNSNKKIKNAFTNKKKLLKTEEPQLSMPPSLKIAGQRIKKLEEENKRLKNENQNLLEQFTIWQYNAYRHNLTEKDLNNPLPPVDR